MKKPIPQPVIFGILGVVVLVVIIAGYMTFKGSAPAQVDPAKIPARRLEDPDPRGGQ